MSNFFLLIYLISNITFQEVQVLLLICNLNIKIIKFLVLRCCESPWDQFHVFVWLIFEKKINKPTLNFPLDLVHLVIRQDPLDLVIWKI